MLNILRVHGKNFCQYPHFDYALGPGLTCIMGSNGTGKSNLVRAMYLCLSGEFYGSGNLVRDGYNQGYVAMDANADKGSFTLRRELKRNIKTGGVTIKHTLSASWLESTLTKKNEITAFMSTWIGGTARALEYVTFARQGKFSELIETEHMARAKMLNTLMGHDRAEKLRGILQDASRQIADMPDRVQLIGMTTYDLEELQKDQEKAETDVATAELSPEMEELHKHALVMQKRAPDTDKQECLAKWTALLEDDENALAGQTILREKLGPEAPTTVPPDEAAYANNIAYQAAAEEVAAEEALSAEHAAKPPEPLPPEITDDERTKAFETMDVLKAKRDKCYADKTAYGNGVCPTCERPYDKEVDLAKLEADAEAFNKEFYEERKRWMDMDSQLRAQDKTLHVFENQTKQLGYRLDAAKAKLLTYIDYKEFDREEHLRQREAYNKCLHNTQQIGLAETAIRAAEKRVEADKLELAKIEGMETATAEELANAKETVEVYAFLKKVSDDAKIAVMDVRSKLKAKKERLQELLDDQEKGQTNREAVELLEFARDQLHAEALPRLAARASINAINTAMSRYLGMFAFPYPFYLNEDLDFVFDRPQAPGVSAEELSGGEMVRAAVAMRFALMEVFKAGCGMLIVDEPTTGQDEDARTALVEVLSIAANHFREQHIKIICPTHAIDLAAAADNIITIGEHQI